MTVTFARNCTAFMYSPFRKSLCRDVPAIGEYFVVLLMYLGACLIYSFTEERTEVNGGLGWDGEHYYNIARQYLESGLNPFTVITEEAPMRFRTGAPYLAAVAARVLGTDILNGFLALNIMAGAFTVLMLYRLIRYFNPSVITGLVLIFFFTAHYYSPFRRSFSYPNMTDSLAAFYIVALLLMIYRYMQQPTGRKLVFICILSFLAVICREFILAPALGFVFAGNPLQFRKGSLPGIDLRRFRPVYFLPLMSGVLGIVLTHVLSRQSALRDDYRLWHHIGHFLQRSPLEYLHVGWIVFGPSALLFLLYPKRVRDFFFRWQPYFIYGGCVIAVSYIGGTDVERFLFWGVPLYLCVLSFLILDRSEQKLGKMFLFGLIIVIQLVANRVFW